MSPNDGVVLLSGANGGLGLALAEYFLSRGERKIVFAYNSDSRALQDLVSRFDLEAERYCFQADLTDEKQTAALRSNIQAKWGHVRAIVNLAGTTSNGMSWKLSLDEFRRVVDVNLSSAFLCAREFIPGMREAGEGRIINISSVAAFSAGAGTSHYSAAKAGVAGLTRALAAELAPKKITVNAIALGYFNYGMIDTIPESLREEIKGKIPLKRFGSAAELGGLLSYLLSPEGAYVTGQTLHLNGGLYT